MAVTLNVATKSRANAFFLLQSDGKYVCAQCWGFPLAPASVAQQLSGICTGKKDVFLPPSPSFLRFLAMQLPFYCQCLLLLKFLWKLLLPTALNNGIAPFTACTSSNQCAINLGLFMDNSWVLVFNWSNTRLSKAPMSRNHQPKSRWRGSWSVHSASSGTAAAAACN